MRVVNGHPTGHPPADVEEGASARLALGEAREDGNIDQTEDWDDMLRLGFVMEVDSEDWGDVKPLAAVQEEREGDKI